MPPLNPQPISRRAALSRIALTIPAIHAGGLLTASGRGITNGARHPAPIRFSRADHRFLDELERASLLFFLEATDRSTGLTKDRSAADAQDARDVASIAATGFALTALCIGDKRSYIAREEARERTRTALRFLWEGMPHEHGFFYHFVNMRTGERVWKCEISSIDTAILICGVLSCAGWFRDPEIRELANLIYERVNWPWLLDSENILRHGWKPESGFLKWRWEEYSEHMMLYLLALGSPTHPIPEESWHAWKRPVFEYEGLRYFNVAAPLFIHQYSHAWFDFQNKRDNHADYFRNSIIATQAHLKFCLNLQDRFPFYSEDLWGITASDSAKGYVAWGGPPEHGRIDGTVVPAAAAGSIPFLPRETLRTLKAMRDRYQHRIWKRYGFVDAFNPHTGWTNPDVIGIDVGISLLMAENARSRFVWDIFMRSACAPRGMQRAGFKSTMASP
jgi:hypothetical protein